MGASIFPMHYPLRPIWAIKICDYWSFMAELSMVLPTIFFASTGKHRLFCIESRDLAAEYRGFFLMCVVLWILALPLAQGEVVEIGIRINSDKIKHRT